MKSGSFEFSINVGRFIWRLLLPSIARDPAKPEPKRRIVPGSGVVTGLAGLAVTTQIQSPGSETRMLTCIALFATI